MPPGTYHHRPWKPFHLWPYEHARYGWQPGCIAWACVPIALAVLAVVVML